MATRKRLIALLPVALAMAAVGAILSEPPPIAPGYIGPRTGDPEKDTYGRDLTGRAAAPALPRYSDTPRLIGEITGNPERDTFGFVALRGSAGALAAAD